MKKGFICLQLLMLLASEFVACQSECPVGQTFVNGKCKCREEYKIISLDKLKCVDNCAKGELIENQSDGIQSCVNQCSQGQSLDGINCQKDCLLIDRRTTHEQCLKTYSDCIIFVSKDGKSCLSNCPQNENVVDKQQYLQCVECSEGQELAVVETQSYCVKICQNNEIYDITSERCIEPSSCSNFLTEDQSYCVFYCNRYDITTMIKGKTIKQCQSKCPKMNYIDESNRQFCYDSCPEPLISDLNNKKCVRDRQECDFAVSADEKYCVEQCSLESRETVVSKKCTDCLFYFSPSKKSCKESCSQGEITDVDNSLCYGTESDCKTVLSSDGTQCLPSCNPKKREISKLRSDETNSVQYKQCEVCHDFYYAGDGSNQSTCQPRCDDGKITIFPQKTCTKKREDCYNYSLSADKKICYQKCIPPQILRQWQCIDISECSGVNEIIDETTEQKECKDKTAKGYSCPFESADGRRCVSSCLSIKQVEKKVSESLPPNSSKKCKECKSPKNFFFIQQNGQLIGECKREKTVPLDKNKKNTDTPLDLGNLQANITNLLNSINFTNSQEVRRLISKSEEVAITIFESLIKEKNLQHDKYAVLEFGSNSTALIFLQLVKEGNELQQSFNIDDMSKKKPLDLTQKDLSQINNVDTNSRGIFFLIIRHNPNCKKGEACFDYPVVQAKKFDPNTNKIIAAKDQRLVAIFTSQKQSQNYVCLNYDNTLTNDIILSRFKITGNYLACPLIGYTSVQEVSKEEYIDESNSNYTDQTRRILRAG